MLSENTHKANGLYNEGVLAYRSGELDDAIEVWQAAADLKPALGLEVMIRRNLTIALFAPFKGMPEGSRLTTEEAERFHRGEKCLSRLTDLCSESAPEGPITDLGAQDLSDTREMTKAYSEYLIRAGRGWWIFPGCETPRRMCELASWLGDKGQKEEAVKLLHRALKLLDTSESEQREIASFAYARLANLLNALGHVDDAGSYAKHALSLGLPKDHLQYDMMKHLMRKSGRSWGEYAAKSKRCFIATAAYGCSTAPEVTVLRSFRDEVLCDSKVGRSMVLLYYMVAPNLARILDRSPLLLRAVKSCLIEPFVRWCGSRRIGDGDSRRL